MWSKIGETSLRTGENMQIYMVKAPDRDYGREIVSFLSLNNRLWGWHLDLAIRGALDELEARFYLGLLEGKIISNVSTWEHGSIGIVAHLFTARNHRGKGACTALLKTQIQDFLRRNGKVLIGGFRPASHSIAESMGFKSIIHNSEVMHYDLDPDFEKEHFQAKNVSCRDTEWKDWPGVSLLFGIREECRLRSMKHRIFGPYDYEDYFLEDMNERLEGYCVSKVLTSEEDNIIGYATLTSAHRVNGNFRLVDFFVHPATTLHLNTMFDTLDVPSGKTRCYVESNCREKREALLRCGFKEGIQRRIRYDKETMKIIAMEF